MDLPIRAKTEEEKQADCQHLTTVRIDTEDAVQCLDCGKKTTGLESIYDRRRKKTIPGDASQKRSN